MTAQDKQKVRSILLLIEAIDDNDMEKAIQYIPLMNEAFGATYQPSQLLPTITFNNANETFAYILLHAVPFTSSAHFGEAIKKLTDIVVVRPDNAFLTYSDIVDFIDAHKSLLPYLVYDEIMSVARRMPAGDLRNRLFNIVTTTLENCGTEGEDAR